VTFKKKAAVLSALVAVLALVYVLSFVFDPHRQNDRAFAWLEPELLNLADRIEIHGYGNDGETVVLSRKNNIWGIASGMTDFPVKQGRVEDLLAALTRKGVYPRRAASFQARERLGLEEQTASRIVIRGGAGLPLLDLLIGTAEALGQGVYLRRADKSEIYSGEDNFTLYTENGLVFWYDLRLFSHIETASVQQAEIVMPPDEEGGINAFIFRRSGNGWIIPGTEGLDLDAIRVEGWLRSVLEAEGEDFAAAVPVSIDGSVTLRLGDGGSRVLQIGPEDGEKRRSAVVSQSALVYVLPEWTINRLFRDISSFLKTY